MLDTTALDHDTILVSGGRRGFDIELAPTDLVALLVEAYRSPYTLEARPGLRAAIEATQGQDMRERVHATLAFLGAMPAAFDVIDTQVIEAQD